MIFNKHSALEGQHAFLGASKYHWINYDESKVDVYKRQDRYCGINMNNPYDSYHSGLIDRVMEEKFPITMPYFPASKPFKVYCENFLVDPDVYKRQLSKPFISFRTRH